MPFNPASPVLVIEPDLLSFKKIKQSLVRVGVTSVDCTSNGVKGLAMVKKRPYGLIICEYFLSPMNGFDIMRALRRDPATAAIPFILTTTQEPEMALTAHARALLRQLVLRPTTAATMRARIEAACELVSKAA